MQEGLLLKRAFPIMVCALGILLLASCSSSKTVDGPLASEKVKGNVATFNIVAKKVTMEVKPGVKKEVWTFGGTMPGKEIRVKEGQEVYINLKNELDVPVSIHWHGYKVPYPMDGVPGSSQNGIKPGQTYTYHFIAKDPGTYWYHSHQDSTNQVDRGLYGSFIVEGKNEVKTDKDYTVMVDEIYSKDPVPGQAPTVKEGQGTPYDVFVINGKSGGLIQPLKANTGEKVKIRLGDAGYEYHSFDFGNIPYQIVATDGHEVKDPATIQNKLLKIEGGERYDVVFTMPGKSFKIYDRGEFAPAKDIVIPVINEQKATEFIPEVVNKDVFDVFTYGKPDSAGNLTFNKTYSWTLQEVPDSNPEIGMRYTINGKSAPEIDPIVVNNGDLVKLSFENKSNAIHPMHMHGHYFRVLTHNGVPVQGDIEKDTLSILPGEKYDISFVADNPGEWMFHCHDLPHAKYGMMTQIEYVFQVPKEIHRSEMAE